MRLVLERLGGSKYEILYGGEIVIEGIAIFVLENSDISRSVDLRTVILRTSLHM
jgi:hypothetical protein